jgi:hypothetical protein
MGTMIIEYRIYKMVSLLLQTLNIQRDVYLAYLHPTKLSAELQLITQNGTHIVYRVESLIKLIQDFESQFDSLSRDYVIRGYLNLPSYLRSEANLFSSQICYNGEVILSPSLSRGMIWGLAINGDPITVPATSITVSFKIDPHLLLQQIVDYLITIKTEGETDV